MPPILLVVFHCSLYRKHISSWGAAGLFQFPLLREGRRLVGALCVSLHYFNSRPSARGDRIHRGFFAAVPYFNSRPSARGDRRYAKFPRCIFGTPAQRKNSKKVRKEV